MAVGVQMQVDHVDGVPVLWFDGGPGYAAVLLFRVGRADETLASGGVTHLTHRLASVGGSPASSDRSPVDHLITRFRYAGDPAEVGSLLERTCASLKPSMPETSDEARRLLSLDKERFSGPWEDSSAWADRFGVVGYGLWSQPEYGLTWLEARHVSSWVRAYFTVGNAVLVLSGPPVEGLRLPLTEGRWREPPPLSNQFITPRHGHWTEGPDAHKFIGLSMIGSPPAAVSAALAILRRRLERMMGSDASTTCAASTLNANTSFGRVRIGCRAAQIANVAQALVAEIHRLAEDGPTDEEVASSYGAQNSPGALAADRVERLGAQLLIEGPSSPLWRDPAVGIAPLSCEDLAEAMRSALDTLIMMLPPATEPRDIGVPSCHPCVEELGSKREIEGDVFTARKGFLGLRHDRDLSLTVGQQGVRVVTPSRVDTLEAETWEAVLWWHHGGRHIFNRDGRFFGFEPQGLHDHWRAVMMIDRMTRPEVFVPMDSERDSDQPVLQAPPTDLDVLLKRAVRTGRRRAS